MATPKSSAVRRRGRRVRMAERQAVTIERLTALRRRGPAIEVVDPQTLERIHDASMDILETVGIEFRDPESLSVWRRAGGEVDKERVRIPRELLAQLLASIPERFVLHGRNPQASVEIGGDYSVFAPCYGAPVVHDLDGRRRDSTIADFRNFARLAYQLPAAHLTGGVLCEPMDVPIEHRHLEMLDALIRYSDKPFLGMVTSKERALDSIRMAEIVFGSERLQSQACIACLCNGNSPLVWDATMLAALKVFAANNQPAVCAPFTIIGANSPTSVAAAAAQLNAEALSALAFTQLVRRGAPAIYGAALFAVSMRSGAPMQSGPEVWQLGCLVGQLARRYRVPWRISAGRTTSKSVDALAGYDTGVNLWMNLAAGAHLLLNAIGFVESSLAVGYGKYVLDAEQCEMLQRFHQAVPMADFDEAIATVRDVGPGGHFLGEAHTLAHCEEALFIPRLQFFDSYEQWRDEGSRDAEVRARDEARRLLNHYEPPPIEAEVEAALTDFVARRKHEIGL